MKRERDIGGIARSGIGMDRDEWEEPERLSTSIKRIARNSAASTSTPMTSNESISTVEAEWDKPTPLRNGSAEGDSRLSSSRTVLNSRILKNMGLHISEDSSASDFYSSGKSVYDERGGEEEDFSRNFYLSEEGQMMGGDEQSESHFLGSEAKFKEREEQMAKNRAKGNVKMAGMSAKKSQLLVDQEAWEDNRLVQSGVAKLREVQTEFNDDEDNRITLIVHNLKPPFLDGRVSFSLQQTTVAVVADPTSDLAMNAKKGSALLREVREKKEQAKMRKRFWEIGGSRMGDVMGVAHPNEEEDRTVQQPKAIEVGGNESSAEGASTKNGSGVKADDSAQVDYKEGSSFAKHMKKGPSEAQSQFAKSKTIKQQREYLPIYTVKDRLLDIIRENQIVVIVGETGSGLSVVCLCLLISFISAYIIYSFMYLRLNNCYLFIIVHLACCSPHVRENHPAYAVLP
jgi:pre-mRNA-splicing factor ATP-dependent RNA helicase DHX38/PRP16